MKKVMFWLLSLMMTGLLVACGGGGGDSSGTGSSGAILTSVSSGVAVDPYIVNAQFEEISSDGTTLLQRSSTLSDSRGRFRFAEPVSEDSVIRMKTSARGMHGNAPYAGILKRRVTIVDDGTVVVSPLTTLVANGMSAGEVSSMIASAGLPGLTEEDIYVDPLGALMDRTSGVTETQLRNLQANMAVNGFMEATGDFDQVPADSSLRMSDMVDVIKQTLNATLFAQLAAQVGSDFTLGDLAHTAVQINRTVVSQIRQELADNQEISSSQIDQIVAAAMNNIDIIAQEVTDARLNGDGSMPSPEDPTAPGSGTSSLGAELYAAECQGCHGSLQTTDIGNRTASGIRAAIDANFGGMGSIMLTSEEVQLISDALTGTTTVPVQPPQFRTGQTVYDLECGGCHRMASYDLDGNIDLAGLGSTVVTKIEGGHMGKSLPSQELNALADFADSFAQPEPPTAIRGGQAVYDQNCSVCHKLNGYDVDGNIDLAGMGSAAAAKVPTGHGGTVSTEELTNLASWLDTWTPVSPPLVARDGQTVYDENCSGCHKLYGYDPTGNLDLAGMGNTAATKLATGHGGSVSTEEVPNLTAWLDTWDPEPPPVVDRSGETVYNDNCSGCHKLYGYDSAGSIDLAGQGDLAAAKLATGHGGNVTSGEVVNLANWLDTWTPAPPPVVARSGETVYIENCSNCHRLSDYDTDGNIDLAGQGALVPGKLASGHGGAVSAEEQTNLVNWLDTFQASDPYAGACDTCHGQPPSGSSFPDTAGSHGVHTILNDLADNCAACHTDAAHNDQVDLELSATWDAKSGIAVANADGTCSNIICHGGKTTPDWIGGSLDVDTQCSSCHSYGTSQYNSYFSGKHDKHVQQRGLSCTACHDTVRLRNGHFGSLATRTFEQAPSSTIKSSLSYEGGRCATPGCHSGKTW